jgi:GDP-L-fucose synthase
MIISNSQLDRASRIYVAGHTGMVGSAIVRQLQAKGYDNLVTRTHAELDLTRQADTEAFLKSETIDYVMLAAAKTGGIHANDTYRADFIYQNLIIQANVINSAFEAGVNRLLFLGSSCTYPRDSTQPIKETELLTGLLEKTNEPYAIAKIAGVKLCENYNRQHGTRYIVAMPTNLFGLNDNYDLENSHVLPALIRKAHIAKVNGEGQLSVWGSGRPRREFLYVDDLADACVFLMERGVEEGIYNIGTGSDITIRELVELVMDVVGFTGEIMFDPTKPDGTPRKLLDIGRMHAMGWQARTNLRDGIRLAYEDFCAREGSMR